MSKVFISTIVHTQAECLTLHDDFLCVPEISIIFKAPELKAEIILTIIPSLPAYSLLTLTVLHCKMFLKIICLVFGPYMNLMKCM